MNEVKIHKLTEKIDELAYKLERIESAIRNEMNEAFKACASHTPLHDRVRALELVNKSMIYILIQMLSGKKIDPKLMEEAEEALRELA